MSGTKAEAAIAMPDMSLGAARAEEQRRIPGRVLATGFLAAGLVLSACSGSSSESAAQTPPAASAEATTASATPEPSESATLPANQSPPAEVAITEPGILQIVCNSFAPDKLQRINPDTGQIIANLAVPQPRDTTPQAFVPHTSCEQSGSERLQARQAFNPDLSKVAVAQLAGNSDGSRRVGYVDMLTQERKDVSARNPETSTTGELHDSQPVFGLDGRLYYLREGQGVYAFDPPTEETTKVVAYSQEFARGFTVVDGKPYGLDWMAAPGGRLAVAASEVGHGMVRLAPAGNLRQAKEIPIQEKGQPVPCNKEAWRNPASILCTTDLNNQIYNVPISPKSKRLVPQPLLPDNADSHWSAIASPDGQRMAFYSSPKAATESGREYGLFASSAAHAVQPKPLQQGLQESPDTSTALLGWD